MIKECKKTTIGGAEVEHNAPFSDSDLNMAFTYLYRLQSLRFDKDISMSGIMHYTIEPTEDSPEIWEFKSLSEDIPVCITPQFELAQMVSMANTALTVTETLKNLRMANVTI